MKKGEFVEYFNLVSPRMYLGSCFLSLPFRFLHLVSCLSALASCFSLIKQIPTNPKIQERAVSGIVWSHKIAFLGHQAGIQVIVLEQYPSSVDPKIQE